MTKEIKTLEVPIYRDNEGNHTCAVNFKTGESCPFFRTQRFGTHETCLFASEVGHHKRGLSRRGADGTGTLIPLRTCPLWAHSVPPEASAWRAFRERVEKELVRFGAAKDVAEKEVSSRSELAESVLRDLLANDYIRPIRGED